MEDNTICGLFGIVGYNVSAPAFEKIFINGLIADSIRGMDSTGVGTISPDSYEYYKEAKCGGELVKDSGFSNWMLGQVGCKALMGHNRAATVGAINADGAHPFSKGNILLSHNGTLKGWRNLPDANKFTVDSELIAHLVEKDGIEKTVARLDGAWALSYADLGQGTINFCRNEERPLFFARLRNKNAKGKAINAWVYSSERGLLKWIVERNGYEVVNIFQLKPEKLLSFDINSDMSSFTTTDLEYTEYNKPKNYGQWAHRGYTQGRSKVKNFPKAKAPRKAGGLLPYDEKVAFIATEYRRFKNSSDSLYGYVNGYMANSPWWSARIPYIKEKLIGKLIQSKEPGLFIPDCGDIRAFPVGHTNPADPEGGVLLLSGDSAEILPARKGYSVNSLVGPSGTSVTEAEWMHLVKDGCSFCNETFTPDKPEEVVWEDYMPMCEDCHSVYVDFGVVV